ncbi:MAG: GIY-YIG nuclease family protein [Bacteroidetes bacterium]|nr:GIY-YIG nuclease family protein [Bacteroidota bacterium]
MKELIGYNLIEEYFTEILKELLLEKNKKKILLTRSWAREFPNRAGVYLVFENNNIKYVGETGNIRGRIADMLNTKNHTLRRSFGEANFSNSIGYEKANSVKSYNHKIELELNELIQEKLTISCLPLEIGRKEFEEWVMEKESNILYNKRKKRKMR